MNIQYGAHSHISLPSSIHRHFHSHVMTDLRLLVLFIYIDIVMHTPIIIIFLKVYIEVHEVVLARLLAELRGEQFFIA